MRSLAVARPTDRNGEMVHLLGHAVQLVAGAPKRFRSMSLGPPLPAVWLLMDCA